MKSKTVDQLADDAAKRLSLLKGTPEYDFFCAGFSRGVRAAQRRIGWVRDGNRMVPEIR